MYYSSLKKLAPGKGVQRSTPLPTKDPFTKHLALGAFLKEMVKSQKIKNKSTLGERRGLLIAPLPAACGVICSAPAAEQPRAGSFSEALCAGPDATALARENTSTETEPTSLPAGSGETCRQLNTGKKAGLFCFIVLFIQMRPRQPQERGRVLRTSPTLTI